MKVVFVPFYHKNDYININKKAISVLGVEPVPFSLKVLFESLWNRYPVILNWIEDKPYGSKLNGLSRFITFLKCALLIFASAIFFSKKISIKHNFKPHNSKGKAVYFSCLRSLMRKIGYRFVSLENYEGGGLLHPLYLDDELMNDHSISRNNGPLSFLFFGAVKRYKGLELILNSWPIDKHLKVLGKCDDQRYKSELRQIISDRGLNVTWFDEFLPIEELNDELGSANFVIMNHLDNSMISSGSFYHAISFGCNIVGSPSRFIDAKNERHNFVHKSSNLSADIPKFEANYVCKTQVRKEALQNYSRVKLSEQWRELLLN